MRCRRCPVDFQVGLGLAGDLTRVAGVRLVGQRVDDGEGHVRVLVLCGTRSTKGVSTSGTSFMSDSLMAWKP